MSDWVVIPCLLALRDEFDKVSPKRDRGADGTIGDSSHKSSSDHTPDEDSDVLRDHDADHKNEVHAVDIDCTGPWPDGKGGQAGGWFDKKIGEIVAREKVEYESATIFGRLQYVIWRGKIISRSWGWSGWRAYTGPSSHFDHAHFSGRYLTNTEADTRSWGVYVPPPAKDEDIPVNQADFNKLMTGWVKSPEGKEALGEAMRQIPNSESDTTVNLNAALVTAALSEGKVVKPYPSNEALVTRHELVD